jgi:hypothetical protein
MNKVVSIVLIIYIILFILMVGRLKIVLTNVLKDVHGPLSRGVRGLINTMIYMIYIVE